MIINIIITIIYIVIINIVIAMIIIVINAGIIISLVTVSGIFVITIVTITNTFDIFYSRFSFWKKRSIFFFERTTMKTMFQTVDQ